MCQTRYTQERVLQAPPAQCADVRAAAVHGGYLAHARSLDARHHAGVADADARAIFSDVLTPARTAVSASRRFFNPPQAGNFCRRS